MSGPHFRISNKKCKKIVSLGQRGGVESFILLLTRTPMELSPTSVLADLPPRDLSRTLVLADLREQDRKITFSFLPQTTVKPLMLTLLWSVPNRGHPCSLSGYFPLLSPKLDEPCHHRWGCCTPALVSRAVHLELVPSVGPPLAILRTAHSPCVARARGGGVIGRAPDPPSAPVEQARANKITQMADNQFWRKQIISKCELHRRLIDRCLPATAVFLCLTPALCLHTQCRWV